MMKKNTKQFYSFDIFDTLVTRKTATANGIFMLMQNKISKSEKFSDDFKNNFYHIRIKAFSNTKKQFTNTYGYNEINLDDIYKNIQGTYNLSDDDIKYLKDLEIETEIDNTLPIPTNIQLLKDLINQDNRVILISDMYHSETNIRKILTKIDNIFDNIKIYVSSEYKHSKAEGELYKIIKDIKKVDYKHWIHLGDNKISDKKVPEKLGIKVQLSDICQLLNYEKDLIANYPDNIIFQQIIGISKYVRLNKQKMHQNKYNFGCSYTGPFLFNYVNYVIEETLKMGVNIIYFIARDGYIPKIIADIIIKKRNLNLKTKYIYGSRLAWRIPNENNYEDFINTIFDEVYKDKLSLDLLAFRLNIDVLELQKLTEIKNCKKVLNKDKQEFIKNELLENRQIKNLIQKNTTAKKELLIKYLKQEIDFSNKNVVFVDIQGSGKTQDFLAEIINEFTDNVVRTFYIAMSYSKDLEYSKKYIYCKKPMKHYHYLELLSRTKEGQTIGYKEANGKIVPVFEETDTSLLSKWGYETYLQGIIDFTESITNDNLYINNVKLCYKYFEYITEKCDFNTANILATIPFSVIGSEKNIKIAAPKLSLLTILYNTIFNKQNNTNSDFMYLSVARCKFLKSLFQSLFYNIEFLKEYIVCLKYKYYLKKYSNHKIMFWGASIFLENFLKKNKFSNILGIIDKNPLRHNEQIEGYKIYAPDTLKELNPDYIIFSIKNKHQYIYDDVKKYLEEQHSQIKLLPDMFG